MESEIHIRGFVPWIVLYVVGLVSLYFEHCAPASAQGLVTLLTRAVGLHPWKHVVSSPMKHVGCGQLMLHEI